jgi:hypothetical protein
MEDDYMEPTIITATDLRIKTRDLLQRVQFNGECFIVENFRRPMVALISFDDFMRVKDRLTGLRSAKLASPVETKSNGRRKKSLRKIKV